MKTALILTPVAASMMLPVGLHAQNAAAPPTAPALEQVVVTAQRRTERLQKVPVAVSVLSQTFLRQHDVRTLQDLAAVTPGLVTTNDVGYGSAPLAIRGVGGANGGGNVFADEPVAIYEDGAYVSRPRFTTTDLLDTDSVQVLRGPQGTLFGRNATAGALLITTGQPTDRLTGRFDTTIAEYGEYRASGVISGPLTPDHRLDGRLALGYTDQAGWGTNTVDGSSFNGQHNITGRGTLRYQPTDDLQFSLSYERIDTNAHAGTYPLYDTSNLPGAANPHGSFVVFPYVRRPDFDALINSDKVSLNTPTYTRTTGNNVTLKGQYDLGFATLYSITNYRDWDVNGQEDSDSQGLVPPLGLFVRGANAGYGDNVGHFVDKQWSEELRLASPTDGPFRWTAGGFFYGENNALSPFVINNYIVGPGVPGFAGTGTRATFEAHQQTVSFSGFADGTYRITDKLSFTAGGRYSVDKKDFSDLFSIRTINSFAPPGPPAPLFPAGASLLPFGLQALPSGANTYFYNFSPRGVVDYAFTDKIFAYASISRGYKSGGYNAFATGPTSAFAPEKITAYEVGVKSDLLANRARVNVSLFDYSYANLQIRQGVPSGGISIANVNGARVRGGELETTYLPTEGLTLTGNLAYTDAVITSGLLGQVDGPSFSWGNAPTSVADVTGNQLSRAPHYQLYLSADYRWDVLNLATADALFDYRFQSSEFFLETQQSKGNTFFSKAWNQIDFRVALTPLASNWTVALFINNLNDERHITQVASLFALPVASVNEPRQVGAQLSYRF